MLKTPIQIKLLIAGIKQCELAKQLNITPTTICNIVTFKSHNKRIQETVAAVLHETASHLWGIHYNPSSKKRKGAIIVKALDKTQPSEG